LSTVPGIDTISAQAINGGIGNRHNTISVAASWAGLCPGNAESAGKRFSGRTFKGERYLRRILVQCAWAASRTRDCFLTALFYRLAGRRGAKRATVAMAHRLLTIIHIMIRDGTVYREPGGDYFDRIHPERTATRMIKRLERIGFEAILKRKPLTAVPPSLAVLAEVLLQMPPTTTRYLYSRQS
jgi:transposase